MLLSLNWLKDLVNIPKTITPEEIGQKLTQHTVEVEKTEKEGAKFDKVVVGKVLDVKKHPNADRLNLTKVDVGEKELLSIVCGAPNVAVGQLVVVALVGAELPNGMKIEEREVRGEKSIGMICSLDELGLGEGADGIMVLNKKTKIGQQFSQYLKLEDVIFEVDNKSLANRPDLWGILGMAREIGVLFEAKITKEFERIFSLKLDNNKELEKISVKVEDEELCPRYMAVKISGLEITESPEWLKKRLLSVGMRPINNIVDATNYVMLELGEPMHAFDASLVPEIIVRRAKKEEKIITLDNENRQLDNSVLVIANHEKAIAIAGVMGGENSGINSDTKDIILEAANFNATSVRKTSTKLSLRTESSMRFEKALDPNLCEVALARCFELIKETCPKAKLASQITDLKNFNLKTGPLEIDLDWLSRRLGDELENKKIIKILEALGFEVENNEKNILKVTIPTWRATKDITIKEDVLEEVVRIFGYNNIKSAMPIVAIMPPEENKERILERKIKNILALGASSTEVYNYSFVGEEKLSKMKISTDDYLRLVNPIASNQNLLRQNLLANLLDNVKTNQAKYEEISLFEFGSVFSDLSGTINKLSDKKENLPWQKKHLGLIEAGQKFTVYERVKGKIEYLLGAFYLEPRFENSEFMPEWADKKTYAKIKVSDKEIGSMSMVDEEVLESLGIKKLVAVVEIDFEKLVEIISQAPLKLYEKSGKYPMASRDLAFVVSSKILFNDIQEEIKKFNELIIKVELFDVYEGENLPAGEKSLAFHVEYLSLERTLERTEVDELQKKLIKHLEEKFAAKIRNF